MSSVQSSLLPPNATLLERAAAEACAAALDLGVPLRDLWSPERCPVALLPYLAWAFSVDRWDAAWSEATKRAVIAAAYQIHRHKGTIAALRRVVEPLGYLIRVTEWWQLAPMGAPGTFRIDVGVLDTGITDEMYLELERLIDDAKPLSRHMLGLAVNLESRGALYVAGMCADGDETTVYPYQPGDIVSSGALYAAGITHLIDTLSVQPS